ncbi:hypothetical protein QR77_22350 [Streptomyces sp. 150FB]|uniref:GNAT family N-acetyltransferase n=1 Tax=Streptomyces sp. 150FB TaxID=1576605 RepID=UPI0005890FF7|nr:GNAT family N-acetyltransferase [Streptomyces sp. 150FB]KIF75888.1 hypothetical protein QR77_22350 [Streptomyces sp. 150FB]
MISVRVMTEADIAAVSAIRVAGWRAAYAGVVPRSYLDAMTVETDAEQHRRRYTRSPGGVIDLVAVDDRSDVVGWACLGPSRGTEASPATGELYALYVSPALIGTGIGRALLDAVHTHAAAGGLSAVLLWVIKDNPRARRFYEVAGYAADGATEADDYDGVPVYEVRYRRAVRE